jgi:Na+-driven multidrug efflux pump
VLIANLGALVTSVVLLALLLPGHGAQGAAVATLAAEATLGTISVALLMRARSGLGLELRGIAAVAVATGAALAVSALPLSVPIELFVATAVFALLLRLAGRFPVELANAVLRR